MKIWYLVTPLMLAACTAPPHNDVALQAQPAGAPTYSSVGSNIIPSAQIRYANQPNEINNALKGAVIGAGAGQLIGRDTESTVYGAGAGALTGYYGSSWLY